MPVRASWFVVPGALWALTTLACAAGGETVEAPEEARPLTPEELKERAIEARSSELGAWVEATERAAEANPEDLEVQKMLAEAMRKAKNLDRAADALDAVLKLAPRELQTYRELAEVCVLKGDGQRAMSVARRGLAHHGSDARLYMLEARGALVARDFDAALAALETATQLAPENAGAWLLLGQTLERQGDYNSAQKAFEKAVRFQPDLGPAYAGLGHCLLKLGKGGDAASVLARGLKLVPDSPEILYAASRIALHDGRNAEAATLLERYTAMKAGDWRGSFSLGLARLRQGNADGALLAFTKAAALNAESPELQFDLAMTHSRLGSHEAALSALDAAIKARYSLWLARCERGRVLVRMGRPDDARTAFAKASEQNPQCALAKRMAREMVLSDAVLLAALPCGPPDLDISD